MVSFLFPHYDWLQSLQKSIVWPWLGAETGRGSSTRAFLEASQIPAPTCPGAQDLLQGLNVEGVKLSLLSGQAGNLFLRVFSRQNPKSFITALEFLPGFGLKCVQMQLGGGKCPLGSLQPKACCKVPSGAIGNKERISYDFYWGKKKTSESFEFSSSQSSNWN